MVGSVTHILCKYLIALLNLLTDTISISHEEANVDLIDNLNNVHNSCDLKLVSFDVCSLFTKVPVDGLLSILLVILNRLENPFANTALINLNKLCIFGSNF